MEQFIYRPKIRHKFRLVSTALTIASTIGLITMCYLQHQRIKHLTAYTETNNQMISDLVCWEDTTVAKVEGHLFNPFMYKDGIMASNRVLLLPYSENIDYAKEIEIYD